VRYGELIESARAYVEGHYERPWAQRIWRAIVREVFPYASRVRAALLPVRWAQRVGVWPLLRWLIPFAGMLPELDDVQPLTAVSPAANPRGRVGFLSGCVARELCAATNAATVRVLQRNGWTVLTPPAQGCCGALHAHAGDPDAARRFARWNIDVFPEDLDAIIVNAAGCGAAMKAYGHLLRDDPSYGARAGLFAAKVRDVSEWLAVSLDPPQARIDARVAYHEACHLAHGQRISEAPRTVLGAVSGVELVSLDEADVCCGSAGSYNLVEPAMSRRLLERKIANIRASGATCVASANPGCTLQIRSGLRAAGCDVEVLHPVELLDRAYRQDDATNMEGQPPCRPSEDRST
jgi:glycolate oxidase iron-sulfur subunit